jgi:hypothetical protein
MAYQKNSGAMSSPFGDSPGNIAGIETNLAEITHQDVVNEHKPLGFAEMMDKALEEVGFKNSESNNPNNEEAVTVSTAKHNNKVDIVTEVNVIEDSVKLEKLDKQKLVKILADEIINEINDREIIFETDSSVFKIKRIQ